MRAPSVGAGLTEVQALTALVGFLLAGVLALLAVKLYKKLRAARSGAHGAHEPVTLKMEACVLYDEKELMRCDAAPCAPALCAPAPARAPPTEARNPFVPFFGPKHVAPRNDLLLPPEYEGPNKCLEALMMHNIKYADALTRAVCPISTGAHPELDHPSLGSLYKNYGVGMLLDHGFYLTESGRRTYYQNQDAMCNATVRTLEFDVIEALLMAGRNFKDHTFGLQSGLNSWIIPAGVDQSQYLPAHVMQHSYNFVKSFDMRGQGIENPLVRNVPAGEYYVLSGSAKHIEIFDHEAQEMRACRPEKGTFLRTLPPLPTIQISKDTGFARAQPPGVSRHFLQNAPLAYLLLCVEQEVFVVRSLLAVHLFRVQIKRRRHQVDCVVVARLDIIVDCGRRVGSDQEQSGIRLLKCAQRYFHLLQRQMLQRVAA